MSSRVALAIDVASNPSLCVTSALNDSVREGG